MQIENLIIGGGLAGIYCAWQLQQRNEPFHLLEAQGVLGGRIQPASSSMRIDTGATWFWPHQSSIKTLVEELNLNVLPQHIDGDTLFQQPDGSVQTMGYQQGLSFVLQGGASELISRLLSDLPQDKLSINSPVHSIHRSGEFWQIQCQHQRTSTNYQCSRIFLALPPRMIVEHLTPENWLSDNAIEHLAMQQTWMCAQAKYVAVFEQPVWRGKGHSGFAISHRGPLAEIHDASTGSDHFALFGFLGVPALQRNNIDATQLQLACRKQICEIFDLPGPTEDFLQDWGLNPYVASEQDLTESPRHSQVNLPLLEKDSDLSDCFFIGSEYSQSEPGYMEGAIDAVDRALSKFAR